MAKKPIVNLPRIYTQEVWERTKNEFNKQYIGLPYISWSQVEAFNDKSGFNTGLLGEYEYILSYLCDKKFPDMGWGDFGSQTEAYITLRNFEGELDEKTLNDLEQAKINFTAAEKEILEKIEPLGVFQDEICYYVQELDAIVLGYIDDRSPEVDGKIKLLRDYKTKSFNSKKDLHLDKKHQCELYILGLMQRGLTVEAAEYCIIEREGGKECMNGGGRAVLKVGKEIWYESYSWTPERLEQTHQLVVDTMLRISEIKTIYDKYFSNSK